MRAANGAPTPRVALSRAGIVSSALELADAQGLDGLSMRRLGEALGVEAMSLYHHIPNKAALIDAMVDAVFAEIALPDRQDMTLRPTAGSDAVGHTSAGDSWQEGLRRHACSKRAALRRHPWSVKVLDSRTTPGLLTLQHHNAVLGHLRRNGFGVRASGHAYALLDSYVFGFVNQEIALPIDDGSAQQLAASILGLYDARLEYLAEYAEQVVSGPAYTFADEFDVGLGLVLDALGTLRAPETQ